MSYQNFIRRGVGDCYCRIDGAPAQQAGGTAGGPLAVLRAAQHW